jgi:hypothetical protein
MINGNHIIITEKMPQCDAASGEERKEKGTHRIRAMSRSKWRLLFPGPKRELRDWTDMESAAREAASARLSPLHHDSYMGVVTAA